MINSLPKELLSDDFDDYDEGFNEQFEEMRNITHDWAVKRERKFLEDWCKEAKLTEPVAYNYDYETGFVIYTNHPGIMIGRGGELYNKYKERLQTEFGKNNSIEFVEIKNGFANY